MLAPIAAQAATEPVWDFLTSIPGDAVSPEANGYWTQKEDIERSIGGTIRVVHAFLTPYESGAPTTNKGKLVFWRNNRIKWYDLNQDGVEGDFNLRDNPPPGGLAQEAFCAGHAFLPDGRVLIGGGSHRYYCSDPACVDPQTCCFDGQKCFGTAVEDGWVSVYDPSVDHTTGGDSWDQTIQDLPDDSGQLKPNSTTERNPARWYPTVTELPDGTMLITSGDFWTDLGTQLCKIDAGEVTSQLRWLTFDPGLLPGDPYSLGWGGYLAADEYTPVDGDKTMQLYPHVKVTPFGLFWTGKDNDGACPNTGTDSRLWPWNNTSAVVRHPRAETCVSTETESNRDQSAGVILTLAPGGPFTFLHIGGGGSGVSPSPAPHNSASLITYDWDALGSPTSVGWQWAGQGVSGAMASANARRRPDAVILPDGEVLIIGGEYYDANDPDLQHTANLECEIYDPVADDFRLVAPTHEPRRYHTEALLLPDGRVITAGDEGEDGAGGSPNYEIFYPPHLFKTDGLAMAERPIIASDVQTVEYGFNFTFDVDHELAGKDANDIEEVMLIRPSSVTHSNNMTQRRVILDFAVVANGDSIVATGPIDETYAPPGDYMLIILAKADPGNKLARVPSRGDFVRLQRGSYSVASGQALDWRHVIYLDRSFQVDADGTLNIHDSTTVYLEEAQTPIEITVPGQLLARGQLPDGRIRFAARKDGASPVAGHWQGIRFVDHTDMRLSVLEYCDFEYPTFAISVDSLSGNILQPAFTSSATADIYADRDVHIPAGSEWDLKAPTVVMVANSDASTDDGGEDPQRCEIDFSGTLRTEDLTGSGVFVEFRAATADLVNGKAWYGVSVLGTGWNGDGVGVGYIHDARFDSAVYPLSLLAADTAEVVDSEFWHYEQTGITDWTSDALIQGNMVVRDLSFPQGGPNRVGRVGIHVSNSYATVTSDTVFYNTDKGIWVEGSFGECIAAPLPPDRTVVVTNNQVIADNDVGGVEETGVRLAWICNARNATVSNNNVQMWDGRGIFLDEVSDVTATCNCIKANGIGVIHKRKFVAIDPMWNDVNKFYQNNAALNLTVNVQAKAAPYTPPPDTTDSGLRIGKQNVSLAGENRLQWKGQGTWNYEVRGVETPRKDYAEECEWFDTSASLLTDTSSPKTISDTIETIVAGQQVSHAAFVSAAIDTFGTGFCSTGPACNVPTRPTPGTVPGQPFENADVAGLGDDPAVGEDHSEQAREGAIPSRWELGRPVPNPSRGGVELTYGVPRGASEMIQISVYDIGGRRVIVLVEGRVAQGRHVAGWDGRDSVGRRVGPGVYFVRMTAPGFVRTHKVALLR